MTVRGREDKMRARWIGEMTGGGLSAAEESGVKRGAGFLLTINR
jgi:hypothetical protein